MELALFDILLSAERPEQERLNALNSLIPFLQSEEAADKLAEAVAGEASVTMRTAMLNVLANIDITRITNRAKYVEAFATVACMDAEPHLRAIAVEKLGAIAAHVPEIQEILVETLINDLNVEVQRLSIAGLRNVVRLAHETVQRLADFIPLAPRACKPGLLELSKPMQELVIAFIDPMEPLRADAISMLSGFTVLNPDTVAVLTGLLQTETNLYIRDAVIQILSDSKFVDPVIFSSLFAALEKMPDQPELLNLLTGRLVAHPSLQEGFVRLFEKSTSAGLKIRLLGMLQQSDVPALIISALRDNNPYVREAAMPWLSNKFVQFQEQFEPAIAEIMPKEPLLALRHALVNVLLNTGRKSTATEKLLVELAVSETDHSLKIALAEAVLQVPVTEENRSSLLKLFLEIIEGAYFPAYFKKEVTKRLETFAYSNEPDLKKSLGLLLEQSNDIYEIETVYKLLRSLETDMSKLAPVLIRSLYRHIAYYPQDPLHEWVQMIGKLANQHADIRAELPHIIALTKATWLHTETDKADQTGAFFPTFKQTIQKRNGMQTFMEAERLLKEAWEKRTIKKAEMIELYNMFLSAPKTDGYLQLLVQIMTAGKLATPELVQSSLDYLLTSTDSDGVYTVKKYLQTTGFIDLQYRDRVLGLFTQENYNRYMKFNLPGIHSKTRVKTYNEWEYQGWINPYGQWPAADLVFAIEPGDVVFKLFEDVSSAPDETSLQYLVLEHLFRKPTEVWGKFVFNPANITRFIDVLYKAWQQLPAGNALKDRLLFTLYKKWDTYQGVAAAEVYAAICEVTAKFTPDFNGKQFPQIIKGIDKTRLRELWPWSEEIWGMFEYRYFPKADPDQKLAEELYQQAAKYLQAGDNTAGYKALQDLKSHYSHTKLVKEQQYNIDNAIQKLQQQL
jgi:hypothetical protein